jgi:hypothetical protein
MTRSPLTPRQWAIVGIVALVLALPGWWLARNAFWGAYLAAWWFCAGIALGGMANVWVHNLTGGAWGEPLRPPLLALGRTLPLLAVLFVPLLLDLSGLFPWTHETAKWAGEFAKPGFKMTWLSAPFFIARSALYLVIWIALGWLAQRPRLQRSQAYAAGALIIYGLTVGLAGIDWIMSLVPEWYSTTFGLLLGTGQMLAGLAFAIVLAASARKPSPGSLFRDWGNLLLMYVLTWAYLAFTQYLIIWAENLPHEIAWYLPRLHSGWWWVGWLLILGHFFVPLLILLFRHAKEAPHLLGSLAATLLVLHLVDVWWLILPSLREPSWHALWLGPLLAIAMGALAAAAWLHYARPLASARALHEAQYV